MNTILSWRQKLRRQSGWRIALNLVIAVIVYELCYEVLFSTTASIPKSEDLVSKAQLAVNSEQRADESQQDMDTNLKEESAPIENLKPFLGNDYDILRVGFASEINQFPFWNAKIKGADQEIADILTDGSSQKAEVVHLSKNALAYRGTNVKANLSQVDVIFGLGYFFDKSLKEKRARLMENDKSVDIKHPIEWDNGVLWSSYKKGHRDFTKHASRDFSKRNSPDYVPFLVGYSGEAYDSGDCTGYDMLVVCGGAKDPRRRKFFGCPIVFGLSALRGMLLTDAFSPRDLIVDPEKKIAPDFRTRRFAGFLVKNCYQRLYTPEAAVRPAFFDILSEIHKPVTAIKNKIGRGCRTSNSSISVIPHNSTFHVWEAAIETFKQFKFMITFENRKLKGYFTEKMINALLAGAIPIYFGAPDIAEYINIKRIIHCDVDTTKIMTYGFPLGRETVEKDPEIIISFVKKHISGALRECAERVKRIDEDDELYKEIVSQPILPNNRLEGSEFDVRTVINRVKHAIYLHQNGEKLA